MNGLSLLRRSMGKTKPGVTIEVQNKDPESKMYPHLPTHRHPYSPAPSATQDPSWVARPRSRWLALGQGLRKPVGDEEMRRPPGLLLRPLPKERGRLLSLASQLGEGGSRISGSCPICVCGDSFRKEHKKYLTLTHFIKHYDRGTPC